MNNTFLELSKAHANSDKSFATKRKRIPSDFFDPLARRQNELKVAMMLADCLNSHIRYSLFPGKLVIRRTQ